MEEKMAAAVLILEERLDTSEGQIVNPFALVSSKFN